MRTLALRLISDESGMETVEWAVLAAILVAGLVTVVAITSTNIQGQFQKLNTAKTPD
jgi:Flp pilus assembly pilin Flp